MPRVAILGTGLIGTSIGLRLKSHGRTEDLSIVGWDRRRDNAREARDRNAIDEVARTVEEAVRGAWLIVIAAPVLAIRDLLEQIGEAAGEGIVAENAVVTDRVAGHVARALVEGHVQEQTVRLRLSGR